MGNPEHRAILSQGVETWNAWRKQSNVRPNLSDADLRGANLSRADLKNVYMSGATLAGARLSGANLFQASLVGCDFSDADLSMAILDRASLTGVKLIRANLTRSNLSFMEAHNVDLTQAILDGATIWDSELTGANLREASLVGVNLERSFLSQADLTRANLSGATLLQADLIGADLSGANLTGADLTASNLTQTVLRGAELRSCRVFGTAVWKTDLDGATQQNLVVTASEDPVITVDNLEVAQFLHLLLNNQKLRSIIDTITSKVVLILGRFTPQRKSMLDRLRDELRLRDLLPVLVDFDGPESRDLTETVSTLAHMARFVVADLSDPRSIPQELQKIVPQLPSLPIQPLVHGTQEPWGMFRDLGRYPWVLPPFRYESLEHLCEAIPDHVITPTLRKAAELAARRR